MGNGTSTINNNDMKETINQVNEEIEIMNEIDQMTAEEFKRFQQQLKPTINDSLENLLLPDLISIIEQYLTDQLINRYVGSFKFSHGYSESLTRITSTEQLQYKCGFVIHCTTKERLGRTFTATGICNETIVRVKTKLDQTQSPFTAEYYCAPHTLKCIKDYIADGRTFQQWP